MKSIGLRVYSNSEIYYTVVEQLPNGTLNYLTVSSLIAPKALEKPEQLNFVRNTLLDIFMEYSVTRAGIRLSEFTGFAATSITVERNYLEGLIQEAVASSLIEKYVAGQIATITSLLNVDREDFKKYASAEMTYNQIPADMDWKKLKLEQRESILVCLCAFNL